MKIAIYVADPRCRGRVCCSWMITLRALGHDVLYFKMGWGDERPLLVVEDVDINLIIAGISILRRIQKQGFPSQGKNILWMFDPLTDDAFSMEQRKRLKSFDRLADELDAFIGMNEQIICYAKQNFRHVPAFHIPYNFLSDVIINPLPDCERQIDVLYLAHSSLRRESATAMLHESGLPMYFVHDGLW